jgi:D-alanyl-D-alanine carboxypeptidase
MKLRYIYLAVAVFLLAFYACTEEIIDPVDTCNFTEATNNESNPYNALYKQVLKEYVEENGLPGISIAVETPDYGWWVGSAGLARIEDKVEMTPCHLHHASFVTNIYTATLVMRLVEMGTIELDEPISKYLNEEIVKNLPNGDVLTIRHLMNGTSGIIPYDDNLKMYVDGFNDPNNYTSAENMLDQYIYGTAAENEAGEAQNNWGYTDYDLLGMIIEAASGKTYNDFLDQEIVDVIGLSSTYFNEYPGSPEEDLTVNSYFEHFPGQIQNCSEIQNTFTKVGLGSMGILATPYDYARFLQELMRGNILDSASLALMLPSENQTGMGIEKFRGDERFRDVHGGSYGNGIGTMGVSILALYFPNPDVTIVFSTNLGDIFESEAANSFWRTGGLISDVISITYAGERW